VIKMVRTMDQHGYIDFEQLCYIQHKHRGPTSNISSARKWLAEASPSTCGGIFLSTFERGRDAYLEKHGMVTTPRNTLLTVGMLTKSGEPITIFR
jgi:hypothetical protein